MEPDKTGAPTRIRKSLYALKGTDQRKGYFYCLKLLGVLPPPPNSGFQKWVYNSWANRNQLYTPKCLHDVLIASHARSCEHRNLYFTSYHRHLMVLTEIFLNFAHQVLRGGQKKLRQVYTGPVLDLFYKKQTEELWNNVFTVYKDLKLPDQIANHYWNPTNYLNDEDLTVLQELAPKYTSDKEIKDPIDILFFNINSSYPWEINAPRRWYQRSNDFRQEDLNKFFYRANIDYTQDQQRLINGELDPRRNQKFYEDEPQFINGWLDRCYNFVNNRNFQKNRNDRQNVGTNSILDKELLTNYGAKSKNLHYITEKERIDSGLQTDFVEFYNSNIPHYLYAEAFFNTNIKQFFGENNQIQDSHALMHNNFQHTMNNGTYSITSLMFFPYHSWIDCGVQLYIRKNNGQGQDSFNLLKDLLDFQNPVSVNIIKYTKDFTQKQLKWQISGANKNQEGKVTGAGTYPICEYIPLSNSQNNNSQKLLQASFCARDYILTQSDIRDSLHFNDIYQKYYIDKLHPDRFYFLKIKDYNFDYNYSVEVEKGVWQQLDSYATKLPRYLKDMEGIWIKENQIREEALKGAVDRKSTKSGTRGQTGSGGRTQTVTETVTVRQVQKAQHPIKQKEKESADQPISQVDVEENKKVRKLFESGLYLYASYAPDTKNGSRPISLNLKNAIFEYRKIQKDLQKKAYEKQIVGNIIIFGKEEQAQNCPKCQNNKVQFLDLDENFRVRLPKLWQFIHKKTLNSKLYDSDDKQNTQDQISCVSKYLSLVPNDTFNDYRLIFGAEEIEVSIIDRTTSNQSQYIRLDAQSHSISKNVINSVLSKKFYTFKSKRFDFYKIFDVFNENENDYFDKYVYKRLKGVIFVGSKKIEFNIPIPCYQRLLRLNIQVTGDSQDFRVVVKDADLLAKQIFYDDAIQCQE